MKRLLISIPFLLVAFSAINTGCKKETFSNNYYNPEAAITGNIPALYAGMFVNDRVVPHYWNLYTFLIPVVGTYTQTSGYTNGNKMYEQPVNYTQDRWNYYYTTTIARYREIEKYYNNLTTDEEKAGFQLFLETGRIFLYDQA